MIDTVKARKDLILAMAWYLGNGAVPGTAEFIDATQEVTRIDRERRRL